MPNLHPKKRIGFFAQTSSLGGADFYLGDILTNLDYSTYSAIFFCNSTNPLLNDVLIRPLIAQKKLKIVIVCHDNPTISLSSDTHVEKPLESLRPSTKASILELAPVSLKLFLGTSREILRLIRIFKSNPVDLICFNDTGCEPAAIAAHLARIPHVIGTYHVLPDDEPKSTTWAHRLIEWFSVRSIHLGISVSQATKTAWVKRTGVNPNNLKVIYNGIHLEKFSKTYDVHQIKEGLAIPAEKIIIGIPARLHAMKGHQYLLEGVSQFRNQLPNTIVLIVGSGELRCSLEAMVDKLDIKQYIQFLGYRSDVNRIISIFDFAVFPSVALETFGLAAVECMATGKAVIASDFGGFPEVIKNGVTGILVKPRDSKALGEAIVKLINDPELCRRMGTAGKERAERLFSIDRMLTETFQLYEEVLYGKV